MNDAKPYILGASKFRTAIGLNKAMSRRELYLIASGQKTERISTVAENAKRHGERFEMDAINWAMVATGKWFEYVGENQSKWVSECGRFACRPDGLCSFNPGCWLLEVKCPTDWRKHWPEPAEYMPQIQGEVMIGDGQFEGGLLTIFHRTHKQVWRVPRSDEYIAAMRPHVEYFVECVRGLKEPMRFTKSNPKPVMPEVGCELIKEEKHGNGVG